MKIVLLDAKTFVDADLSLFKQFGHFEAFDTTALGERIEHRQPGKTCQHLV